MKTPAPIAIALCAFCALPRPCARAQWNVIQPNRSPARPLNTTQASRNPQPARQPPVYSQPANLPPARPPAKPARPPVKPAPRPPIFSAGRFSRNTNGGYHVIPYNPSTYAVSPSSSSAPSYTPAASAVPEGAISLGQFLASGKENAIAVPKGHYSAIRFTLVSGSVEISSVRLEPGGTHVAVAKRLQPGGALVIDLGSPPRLVEGIRIKDAGRGVYRVHAQR